MTFTSADMINTALLVVTLIGVLATMWQLRSGARAQRASFLKDLYMQLRSDPEIGTAFYAVEYATFKYDAAFHGSDLEPKLDKLLTLVDLICELHDQGVISTREMRFFDYQFARLARDGEIEKYLRFLDDFFKKSGFSSRPFSAFQTYADANLKRHA